MTPSELPAGVRAVLGALLVAWVVLVAARVLWVPTAGFSLLWDGVLSGLIVVGAAGLVLARAFLVRRERAPWYLLGSALAVDAVGRLSYWGLLGSSSAVAAVAHVLFLSFYPIMYVALVLLLKAKMRWLPTSTWLDGILVALAGTSVSVVVLVMAKGAALSVGAGDFALGLGSVLGDMVLVAIAIGTLILVGWRVDARWLPLCSGFVIYGVLDITVLFQTAVGLDGHSPWLNALWPATALLIAAASWQASRQLSDTPFIGRLAQVPPIVSALTAVGVLCFASAVPLPVHGVVLAAVTLVGTVVRFALSFREVAALADSRRQAMTDELTGLANRRALVAALGQERGDGARIGLLLVDLDRFKEINDSLGHHIGDELLVQMADRLRSATRGQELVARLGGDEFAILLTGQTTVDPVGAGLDAGPEQEPGPGAEPESGSASATHTVTLACAQGIAERIVDALAEPFALDDVTVHVPVSVGIGILPDHTDDPMRLLQRADVAMYTAKSAASRIGVYRAQDDPHSKERLQLLEELRESLRRGELTCYFQPKIELATGGVESVEALCRWEHPTRGLLGPEEFLSLAEHAGLMRELTAAVLDSSLAQVRAWRKAGLHISVAVNLSPTNLLDLDLPEQIGQILHRQGLEPASLLVEITETVMMTNSARSKDVLSRLRAQGVRASIDDYGTGYSSLAYLQDLNVDELKLDRAFVSRMTRDARAAAIVRSTVDLAHSLGMRLVAEGVEDAETDDTLRSFGCDMSQGYHHCRPVPGEELTRWILARRAVPRPRSAPEAEVRAVAGFPAGAVLSTVTEPMPVMLPAPVSAPAPPLAPASVPNPGPAAPVFLPVSSPLPAAPMPISMPAAIPLPPAPMAPVVPLDAVTSLDAVAPLDFGTPVVAAVSMAPDARVSIGPDPLAEPLPPVPDDAGSPAWPRTEPGPWVPADAAPAAPPWVEAPAAETTEPGAATIPRPRGRSGPRHRAPTPAV